MYVNNKRRRHFNPFALNTIILVLNFSLLMLHLFNVNYTSYQQHLKIIVLQFDKFEWFSLTWSCESRQRDTASSGWEFQLKNVPLKGLIRVCGDKNVNVNCKWHIERSLLSRLRPHLRMYTDNYIYLVVDTRVDNQHLVLCDSQTLQTN